MLSSMPDRITLKRPDKIVAGIIAALVIGLLGYGLFVVLPYLITLAENTITFVLELAALAVIVMVLADRDTWTMILYQWKNISRNLRRGIARQNPIGVMDTVIERFARKLEEIDDHMTKAAAACKRHEANIKTMRKKAADEDAIARTAISLQKSELEIKRHATAALRWEKAAEDMVPMGVMLSEMQEKMEQARDLCANTLEDTKNQREVFAMTYETMTTSQKTVKSFKRFFGTNPDLAMLEMSIDEIERQTSEAEAEIDQFMRVMTPAMEAADLKKQAEAQEAMSRFGKFLQASPTPTALPQASKPIEYPIDVQKLKVK